MNAVNTLHILAGDYIDHFCMILSDDTGGAGGSEVWRPKADITCCCYGDK